ncbi:hypothetical protein B0H16DRAFT_947202 [Mycena metata]|uniref:F-box domain-containing protein n=1 Tax=Mycena metata TaxID=1033252 RepID=A0AAD7K2M1_9AGAR|nr:hypothetical protein B0H16DRAFT_947202 [Mycena metata]
MAPSGNPDLTPLPGSRHCSLLNSNVAALDSDVDIIRERVFVIDTRLTNIKNAIARLEQTKKQLEEEYASVLNLRTRTKAILSPLRRIPSEILSEIFSWTLPGAQDLLRRHQKMCITTSPWVLTHISNRWRSVAISDPSLWSLLTFNFGLGVAAAYPIPMVETQVARARNLKHHLYGSQNHFPHQIEIFRILIQQAPRWEDLDLELTPDLVPLLADLRGRIPLLQRLWIGWRSEPTGAIQPIHCFRQAPSLLDATVNPHSILFPVGNLTRYQLLCPWDVHARILKSAPNLVEALVGVRDQPVWPVQEPIDVPRLRRLATTKLQVLDSIRSPSLEELALQVSRASANSRVVATLESLLTRSSCTLWRLCISGVSGAQTSAVIRQISSIIDLRILIPASDLIPQINILLETLTVSDVDNAPVAPHLTSISFGVRKKASSGDVDYAEYLRMVTSRWKSPACALRHASLLISSQLGPDPATLDGLKMLRSEGLDGCSVVGKDAMSVLNSWVYATPIHY